jgi:hypothetical protein
MMIKDQLRIHCAVGSILVLIWLGTSCGSATNTDSPYYSTDINNGTDEDSTSDNPVLGIAQTGAVPVTAEDLTADYILGHDVPPFARAVANGKKPDLKEDTALLALLDSMVNGVDMYTRLFYFIVVSKTLKWSDGYYSEAIGGMGTSHLFQRPSEFLEAWANIINIDEQRSWAWYLAAEENIESEGHSVDLVMNSYRHRLDSATKDLPSSLFSARTALINRIDSVYRELAFDDRPFDPREEGN